MLIRLPDSWPHLAVALMAMAVLAAVDLLGAVVAKEAVLRRSVPLGAFGVLLFVLLFWIYASSLRYADLAPVTFGWIVLLQVGVVLIDRFKYDTPMSRGQWAAVVVLLAAQGYLLLAPSAPAASPSTSALPTAANAQVDVALELPATPDVAVLDVVTLDPGR
jgi:hypothetical protein